MFDHINIPVSDLPKSRSFYDAVLEVFKAHTVADEGDAIGYGKNSWDFGIVLENTPIPPLHVAFQASSHEVVDAFYHAAIAAGGQCNGGPGERSEYGAGYYAAFVHDPDGHNIEAVCRA